MQANDRSVIDRMRLGQRRATDAIALAMSAARAAGLSHRVILTGLWQSSISTILEVVDAESAARLLFDRLESIKGQGSNADAPPVALGEEAARLRALESSKVAQIVSGSLNSLAATLEDVDDLPEIVLDSVISILVEAWGPVHLRKALAAQADAIENGQATPILPQEPAVPNLPSRKAGRPGVPPPRSVPPAPAVEVPAAPLTAPASPVAKADEHPRFDAPLRGDEALRDDEPPIDDLPPPPEDEFISFKDESFDDFTAPPEEESAPEPSVDSFGGVAAPPEEESAPEPSADSFGGVAAPPEEESAPEPSADSFGGVAADRASPGAVDPGASEMPGASAPVDDPFDFASALDALGGDVAAPVHPADRAQGGEHGGGAPSSSGEDAAGEGEAAGAGGGQGVADPRAGEKVGGGAVTADDILAILDPAPTPGVSAVGGLDDLPSPTADEAGGDGFDVLGGFDDLLEPKRAESAGDSFDDFDDFDDMPTPPAPSAQPSHPSAAWTRMAHAAPEQTLADVDEFLGEDGDEDGGRGGEARQDRTCEPAAPPASDGAGNARDAEAFDAGMPEFGEPAPLEPEEAVEPLDPGDGQAALELALPPGGGTVNGAEGAVSPPGEVDEPVSLRADVGSGASEEMAAEASLAVAVAPVGVGVASGRSAPVPPADMAPPRPFALAPDEPAPSIKPARMPDAAPRGGAGEGVLPAPVAARVQDFLPVDRGRTIDILFAFATAEANRNTAYVALVEIETGTRRERREIDGVVAGLTGRKACLAACIDVLSSLGPAAAVETVRMTTGSEMLIAGVAPLPMRGPKARPQSEEEMWLALDALMASRTIQWNRLKPGIGTARSELCDRMLRRRLEEL